jgi:hypothetical protein
MAANKGERRLDGNIAARCSSEESNNNFSPPPGIKTTFARCGGSGEMVNICLRQNDFRMRFGSSFPSQAKRSKAATNGDRL